METRPPKSWWRRTWDRLFGKKTITHKVKRFHLGTYELPKTRTELGPIPRYPPIERTVERAMGMDFGDLGAEDYPQEPGPGDLLGMMRGKYEVRADGVYWCCADMHGDGKMCSWQRLSADKTRWYYKYLTPQR